LADLSFRKTQKDLSYLFVNPNDFIIKAKGTSDNGINHTIYFHKFNCKFYRSCIRELDEGKITWYEYDNSYFRV